NSIFTCSVIGLLSLLLSAVTFALGYFYGVSKNCRNEMAWMRSKIAYLRSTDPDAADKGETGSASSTAAEKFIEKYYGEKASDSADAKDTDDKEKDKDAGKDTVKDKSEDKTEDKAESKDSDKDKPKAKDNSDIEFEYADESDESGDAKK
ncbi:MAG: hypothetical protein J5703_03790, partial [Methanomicrobium sp.]|nr:hypothetical protein [Methanomicrobium sp.]